MLLTGPTVIVYSWLPSAAASSCPVIVIVCAVFQLVGVNVRLAGETVPSVSSLDETAIETLSEGSLVSATVKVEVPPPSVVLPDNAETSSPATSSLVQVTEIEGGRLPLYLQLVFTVVGVDVLIVSETSSLTRLLSIGAIEIVCSVDQLAGVNVRVVGVTVTTLDTLGVRVKVTLDSGSDFSLYVAVTAGSTSLKVMLLLDSV